MYMARPTTRCNFTDMTRERIVFIIMAANGWRRGEEATCGRMRFRVGSYRERLTPGAIFMLSTPPAPSISTQAMSETRNWFLHLKTYTARAARWPIRMGNTSLLEDTPVTEQPEADCTFVILQTGETIYLRTISSFRITAQYASSRCQTVIC